VGLTSITYPVPPERSHRTRSPFEKDDLLCRIKWSEKALDIQGNVVVTTSTLNIKGSDLTPSSITSGKALMKFIVNRFRVELRSGLISKGETVVTTDGKNVYPVFRWEGDDLILDNSKTFLNEVGTRKRPEVLFGVKLVEAMKWIGREDPGAGFFMMTGNLNTEADAVPTDVNRDWAYID